MIDNMKEFEQLKVDLENQLKNLRPNMDEAMQKIKEMSGSMQPKLIKDTYICGSKAKITIFSDDAIRIEFDDKAQAEKYYNSCQ